MRQVALSLLKTGLMSRLLRTISGRKVGFRLLRRLSNPRMILTSFPEAQSVCKQLKHASHENSKLVEGNFWLSVKTRPSDYPVMFWLSRIMLLEGLKVFDFGGGVGQTYYQYSRFLPSVQLTQWTVMDLPEVIAGRNVARQQQVPALRFTSSLSDCEGCNVFVAAGSLHYWEHAIADLAHALGGLPQHVLINRSPVRPKGQSFVSIQRGENWAFPCLVRSSEELEKEFVDLGYEVVDKWPVLEKTMDFPLFPDYVAPYAGFYLRRKESLPQHRQ